MSDKIKIGHAVADENGGSDGQSGDQTGKEIRIQDWYKRSGGWDYYLECTDADMSEKAAKIMTDICNSPAFGYSKKKRWTGYKSIVANNNEINGAAESNFDCSSLCLSCYILAGLNHKASGYTQSMRKSLLATKKFVVYSDKDHLDNANYAKIGGLYLSEGHHVCMVLNNGPKAGTVSKIKTEIGIANTKVPRVEILGSVNVRKDPTKYSKVLKIARRGSAYDYIATTTDANGNEWYAVRLSVGSDEYGFVSAFTGKKKKYTKLVKEN